jgi:hypothetical protein
VLASVAPAQAVEALCAHIEAFDSEGEIQYARLSAAVSAVVEVDVTAATGLFPAVAALYENPADVTGPLAVAVAAIAAETPAAVAPHVETIAPCLCHPVSVVREATATALAAVGREHRDAVPEPSVAICERADDAASVATLEAAQTGSDSFETPDDWPAGALSERSVAVDAAIACLAEERVDGGDEFHALRQEFDAGYQQGVWRLTAELLARQPASIGTRILHGSYWMVNPVKDTVDDPELGDGVDALVETLTDPAFETRAHPDDENPGVTDAARGLERGLIDVAVYHPRLVAAGIKRQCGTIEAFVSDHETAGRRRIAYELGAHR